MAKKRTQPEVAEPAPQLCRVHIRWMIERDMKEVVEIEALSYEGP